jgi:hypothetical protein
VQYSLPSTTLSLRNLRAQTRAFALGVGLFASTGAALSAEGAVPSAQAEAVDPVKVEQATPSATNTPAEQPPTEASQAKPDKNDKSKADRAEKSEDLPRKVKSTSHLHVIAKDLKFNEARTQKLKRIADRYFEATHKRLVVTGGTRTPDKQAQLMVAKFLHGDAVERLYENRVAFKEIKKAFESARTTSRTKLVKAVRDVILAQVARGEFISKHLQFAATDIRSHGMTPDREAAFKAAVAAETGVTLLDERDGPEAHFHLSF